MESDNASEDAAHRDHLDGDIAPIAIIGVAFEFAQDATSEEGFWEMIHQGRSASSEFPKDRLNIDAFYDASDSHTSTFPLRGGHFVTESLAAFDAPFFSITPAEAACMDPQQRRMLETAYHALEDAGVPLSKCCGSETAVYTGCFTSDYEHIIREDYDAQEKHAALGVATSMLANRVSWFFDFKGPSMNLNSACSSSLLALHLAVEELRAGPTSMALVGGVNLVYHPGLLKMLSNVNLLSPDSRSWSFDERANGYARGEGTAVLVVKRLEDAVRDGDTIRAVIRNTGSNQDGRTPGLTNPNMESEVKLIRRAYQQAHLDLEPTRYFEAHGAGTTTGDSTEANAIGTVFTGCRSSDDPLYIGAVKANIGHLEGASGLAGVIKTILVLENGIIPPIAGLQTLNESINATDMHLHFPQELVRWPDCSVRRACVNSFGFGGTNATVILDDAYNYLRLRNLSGFHRTKMTTNEAHAKEIAQDEPDPPTQIDDYHASNTESMDMSNPPKLLVWSAQDKTTASRLGDAIESYWRHNCEDIPDIAYNLAARRSHLSWRDFQIVNPLSEHDSSGSFDRNTGAIKSTEGCRLVFVFTGQGAQYAAMARGLAHFSAFRKSVSDLDDCLKELGCEQSLREIAVDMDAPPTLEPKYSQVITTCLQIALVDFFRSLNVKPSLVVGHSLGEIAASYASGALNRSSAVKVAYWRGILSSNVAEMRTDLGMMAVGVSRSGAEAYIKRLEDLHEGTDVSIACANSPKSVTLTGVSSQLSTVEQWCQQDNLFVRKLDIPTAYNSSFMGIIEEDFKVAMGELQRGTEIEPSCMVSSVTGDIVQLDELATPEYWVRNLLSTVEFEKSISRILTMSDDMHHILEIGPHSTLERHIRDCLQASEVVLKPIYIPCLQRRADPQRALLKAVGTLHCHGYPVNLLLANNLADLPRPMIAGMPPYPFNHSQHHWTESRLSKNFRFREAGRHELVGTQDLDWNPHMAKWHNRIYLSEVPWLMDHKIDGQIIFPAAGMLVMAIEALRMLLRKKTHVNQVHIQNVSFLRPMKFSVDMGCLEVQLQLSSESDSVRETKWALFRLFMIEGDEYLECCHGYIRPILDGEGLESASDTATFLENKSQEDWTNEISRACRSTAYDFYDLLTQSGSKIELGSCFQNVKQLHLSDKGDVVAVVSTEGSELPIAHCLESALYTKTLDALFQVVMVGLFGGPQARLPTMVPSHLKDIWIDMERIADSENTVAAKCKQRAKRGLLANIAAMSTKSKLPLGIVESLESTFIDEVNPTLDARAGQVRKLCTQVVWKPDIDLMSHAEVTAYCVRDRSAQPIDKIQNVRSLNLALMAFVEEGLGLINRESYAVPRDHLKQYVEWMNQKQQALHAGDFDFGQFEVQKLLNDHCEREKLISDVESSGVEGAFFMYVGKNLLNVLQGITDPLDLMFQSTLVDRYYENMLAEEYTIHPLLKYLNLMSFKNPAMRILEIGAGTGGQTLQILRSLSSDGVKKWARYDYTDISSSFFDRVYEKFQDYSSLMHFQTCDISKDPASQSFELETYDLVLAGHVLRTTNNIQESLSNIKKLLKPDGKLILGETTRPECLRIGFAFGLLPGWWNPLRHEPRSDLSPCLTATMWHKHLQEAGFSGVDIEFLGQQDPQIQYSGILISSLASTDSTVSQILDQAPVVVVSHSAIHAQNLISMQLEDRLHNCRSYSLSELSTADLPSDALIVFLLEVDTVFLYNMSQTDYETLKSVLLAYKNTLWISKSYKLASSQPQHHLAVGLGRCLSSEDITRKFITLALDGFETEGSRCIDAIVSVIKRTMSSPVSDLENNYVARANNLQICRLIDDPKMNTHVAQAVAGWHHREHELGSEHRLELKLHGTNSTIPHDCVFCHSGTNKDTPLDANDIEVEVKAIGLSHRDALMLSGKLDTAKSDSFLTECSGVVCAAGDISGFSVGDRVCLLATHTVGTHVRVHAESAFMMPPNTDFAQAATLPTAVWLSHHSLATLGNIQEGETVLIHRANSAFGQIAIQAAIKHGAQVLVTASSLPKVWSLLKRFNLPQEAAFDIHDNLVSRVKKATSGNGADVIIGPLSQDHDVNFSKVLAPSGRLVDTALHATPRSHEYAAQRTVSENGSHSKVDIAGLFHKRPITARKIFQKAMQFVSEKDFEFPQPLHVFGANKLQEAFDHLTDNSNHGKRVIEFHPGTTVMAKVETKTKTAFSADATYLIAGGLGNLGRIIARWMVTSGARNIVLLSRSGPGSHAAKDFVQEIQDQGVRCLTPIADISNLASLKSTLDDLMSTGLPPIKGCFQVTRAPSDNLFEQMTYEDWTAGTKPKVTGSWNLQQALSLSSLDFFIFISSVGGIYGAQSQANDAAGSTFMDALAKKLASSGVKAISIDLGHMKEDHADRRSTYSTSSVRRGGLLMEISNAELYAILDHYCSPEVPRPTAHESQLVTGLELPLTTKRSGFALHHALSRPLCRQLFCMNISRDYGASTADKDSDASIAARFRATASDAEALEIASGAILRKVSSLAGVPEPDIDDRKSIQACGVDSLGSIDLRNWIQREFGSDVNVYELTRNLSLKEVSGLVVDRSPHWSTEEL